MTHTHPRPTGGTAAADVSARTAGIYVLAAHPNWRDSRINKHLLAAAAWLVPTSTTCTAATRLRHRRTRRASACGQCTVAGAAAPSTGILTCLHCKALLDEVLTHGWAYGHSGHALRSKAICGWWPAQVGRRRHTTRKATTATLEGVFAAVRTTAALCGMQFCPPLILHGAHAKPTKSRCRAMLSAFARC